MIRRVMADGMAQSPPRRLYTSSEATVSHANAPVGPAGDDEAYRQGYDEGFTEGEADALRMGEQRLRELEAAAAQRFDEAQQTVERERQRLAGLVEALEHGLRQHATEIEAMAGELAITGWQHAFGMAVEDRALLKRTIQALLEENRAKALTVQVSTDDRPLLPQSIDGVELIEDNALRAGECRVITAHGSVESSVQQRLRAISDALCAAVGAPLP